MDLDLPFFDFVFLEKPLLVPLLKEDFANRNNCSAFCFFSVSSVIRRVCGQTSGRVKVRTEIGQ